MPGVPLTYCPSTNLIILQRLTQMPPLPKSLLWLPSLRCNGAWALSALSTSYIALGTLDLALRLLLHLSYILN